MTHDDLGDRIKTYERVETGRRAVSGPVVIRLDGRSFSTFTKGLVRPFDERLSTLMQELTEACVHETHARVGYTQSDEITLVLHADTPESQVYFDGRIQKITSVLAAFASVWLNRQLPCRLPEKANQRPVFDCRAFEVPTLTEAANAVLWRELDATKNAISMATREHFSVAEMHGQPGHVMIDMLRTKGVDWHVYPDFFKRGTFVQRAVVRSRLTSEELEALPPKHNARLHPDLEIERNVLRTWSLPPLRTVTNRVACLFFGEEPQIAEPTLSEDA